MLTGELDACVASHKVQLQCSGRSAVLSLSTGHDSHRGVDRSSSSVNLASAYPEGAAVEGRRASQDHWRSVQHRMQPLVLQQEVLASLDLHHHSAVATRMSECSAKTHARFDDAMQTEIKATSEAVRQALCKGHGVDPSTGVQVLHVDALERTVQVALKAGEDFVLDALGKAHLEAYKEAGQHVKTLSKPLGNDAIISAACCLPGAFIIGARITHGAFLLSRLYHLEAAEAAAAHTVAVRDTSSNASSSHMAASSRAQHEAERVCMHAFNLNQLLHAVMHSEEQHYEACKRASRQESVQEASGASAPDQGTSAYSAAPGSSSVASDGLRLLALTSAVNELLPIAQASISGLQFPKEQLLSAALQTSAVYIVFQLTSYLSAVGLQHSMYDLLRKEAISGSNDSDDSDRRQTTAGSSSWELTGANSSGSSTVSIKRESKFTALSPTGLEQSALKSQERRARGDADRLRDYVKVLQDIKHQMDWVQQALVASAAAISAPLLSLHAPLPGLGPIGLSLAGHALVRAVAEGEPMAVCLWPWHWLSPKGNVANNPFSEGCAPLAYPAHPLELHALLLAGASAAHAAGGRFGLQVAPRRARVSGFAALPLTPAAQRHKGSGPHSCLTCVTVPNLAYAAACGWGRLLPQADTAETHTPQQCDATSTSSALRGGGFHTVESIKEDIASSLLMVALAAGDTVQAADALLCGLACGGGGMRLMPLSDVPTYAQLHTLLRAIRKAQRSVLCARGHELVLCIEPYAKSDKPQALMQKLNATYHSSMDAMLHVLTLMGTLPPGSQNSTSDPRVSVNKQAIPDPQEVAVQHRLLSSCMQLLLLECKPGAAHQPCRPGEGPCADSAHGGADPWVSLQGQGGPGRPMGQAASAAAPWWRVQRSQVGRMSFGGPPSQGAHGPTALQSWLEWRSSRCSHSHIMHSTQCCEEYSGGSSCSSSSSAHSHSSSGSSSSSSSGLDAEALGSARVEQPDTNGLSTGIGHNKPYATVDIDRGQSRKCYAQNAGVVRASTSRRMPALHGRRGGGNAVFPAALWPTIKHLGLTSMPVVRYAISMTDMGFPGRMALPVSKQWAKLSDGGSLTKLIRLLWPKERWLCRDADSAPINTFLACLAEDHIALASEVQERFDELYDYQDVYAVVMPRHLTPLGRVGRASRRQVWMGALDPFASCFAQHLLASAQSMLAECITLAVLKVTDEAVMQQLMGLGIDLKSMQQLALHLHGIDEELLYALNAAACMVVEFVAEAGQASEDVPASSMQRSFAFFASAMGSAHGRVHGDVMKALASGPGSVGSRDNVCMGSGSGGANGDDDGDSGGGGCGGGGGDGGGCGDFGPGSGVVEASSTALASAGRAELAGAALGYSDWAEPD